MREKKKEINRIELEIDWRKLLLQHETEKREKEKMNKKKRVLDLKTDL